MTATAESTSSKIHSIFFIPRLIKLENPKWSLFGSEPYRIETTTEVEETMNKWIAENKVNIIQIETLMLGTSNTSPYYVQQQLLERIKGEYIFDPNFPYKWPVIRLWYRTHCNI
jgi:hypothetical protein